MDKEIKYVNSAGEEVRFAPDSELHYGETDLHGYAWDYDFLNERVQWFARTPRTFALKAHLRARNGLSERNRMTDVFERDVRAKEPGKLWINDYWMECWVVASEKSGWHFDDGVMTADLTILAEKPVWLSSTKFEYLKGGESETPYLDLPFDLPCDLKPTGASRSIDSPYVAPSKFKLTVYGPAVSPYVFIGENRYEVDVSVDTGGILVVDSKALTITLSDVVGNCVNAFSKGVRGAGRYIFEPIPSGKSDISWDGSFGFDLKLYDERSEPTWS